MFTVIVHRRRNENVLPARRYASRSSTETDKRIGLVFGTGASFDLSTPYCNEIPVHPKTRVFPSGTLLKTLNFENFATAYRSSKGVINLARERWTLRA